MKKDREVNLLLAQYKAVSDQIIHWDTFFWSKSRFFLAVEGIALLGIGKWLADGADSTAAVASRSLPLFVLLAVAVLLNLYLCVVWLRTGIRNREFLNMRFEVGRAMEKYVRQHPAFCLYTYQQWKIDNAKLSGPRSHHLEIGMPAAFAIAWVVILVYLIIAYAPAQSIALSALILRGFIVLILILLTEMLNPFINPPPEAAGSDALWTEFERDFDKIVTRTRG